MKERAIAMMAELDKVRFTVNHHPLLVKSIMELAVLCGTELQYPRAYGNGELGIVTTTAECGYGCRPYGEVFAGLMAGRRCRTGNIEYGYNAIMIPQNGWCYMPYWEVEMMIRKAAGEDIPDTRQTTMKRRSNTSA